MLKWHVNRLGVNMDELQRTPGGALSALFTNRFQIAVDQVHTRIAFGHRDGPEDVYHTAFVMLTSDAAELAAKLKDLIAEVQKKSAPKGKLS